MTPFELPPARLQAWRGAATRLDEQQQQQQQQPAAGAAGFGRRLLAVKAGRGGAGGVVRPGMALHEATAARLCVMQCMQHACISWHKIYMGEAAGGSSMQPASAVPAAAAECMLQCGMPEVESGCLAQVRGRVVCVLGCSCLAADVCASWVRRTALQWRLVAPWRAHALTLRIDSPCPLSFCRRRTSAC